MDRRPGRWVDGVSDRMASPDKGSSAFADVLSRGGCGDGNAGIGKEFDLALLVGRQRKVGVGTDGDKGVSRGRHDAGRQAAQVNTDR